METQKISQFESVLLAAIEYVEYRFLTYGLQEVITCTEEFEEHEKEEGDGVFFDHVYVVSEYGCVYIPIGDGRYFLFYCER